MAAGTHRPAAGPGGGRGNGAAPPPPAHATSAGRGVAALPVGASAPGVSATATSATSATSATPPSRVSVLAPTTRLDVALPPDVPVAELLPVLLDLAGEAPSVRADRGAGDGVGAGGDDGDRGPGGTARGGWTLAPLGGGPAGPDRTLASLGVLDGDQLVLRRRADTAPPPLFDDVVDAVAEATPASFRPWGPAIARRLALSALALALAVTAIALLAAGRGPGTAAGLVTAGAAGLGAVAALALGAVCARTVGQPAAGSVLGVGAAALAAVCGALAVPAPQGEVGVLGLGAPHLLLAAVLSGVTAVAGLLVLGASTRSGTAALVAVATSGLLLALTAGIATVADAGDAPALAAGAGAVALIAASLLPRASIALARLPLPVVPGSAQELADDPGVASRDEVERRTDRAHAVMAGLLVSCGALSAGAVAVLAAAPPGGVRGVFAWILAVLLFVLLALRSRTYGNGVHAVSLLVCALVAGTLLAGGAVAATAPGAGAIGLAAGLLGLGGLLLTLGVAVPGRRFSPVARRAVDIVEAVLITAVLPVALAVMDLYTTVRRW